MDSFYGPDFWLAALQACLTSSFLRALKPCDTFLWPTIRFVFLVTESSKSSMNFLKIAFGSLDLFQLLMVRVTEGWVKKRGLYGNKTVLVNEFWHPLVKFLFCLREDRPSENDSGGGFKSSGLSARFRDLPSAGAILSLSCCTQCVPCRGKALRWRVMECLESCQRTLDIANAHPGNNISLQQSQMSSQSLQQY